MAKIILIRHAQASLGKHNYDELSPLGMKQAKRLGEYIQQAEWQPETVISGTLVRHRQTAEAIIQAQSHSLKWQENSDWNEFDFTTLIKCYLNTYPEQTPEAGNVRGFFSILKKSMLAWSNNELTFEDQQLESWENFAQRIGRAIAHTQTQAAEKPTVVVSSGGAIAMLLKQILEINARTMIELNFQIRNTSFTEIILKPRKQSLVAFNQVNHFSGKEFQHLLTYA